MIHYMKLQNGPFVSIKSGKKTIEMRLFDEKRKLINVGDNIQFTNILTGENIMTKVLNLYTFPNFNELYNHFDKIVLGYNSKEQANPQDMQQYYSLEEQSKYGVLAIEVKLIV